MDPLTPKIKTLLAQHQNPKKRVALSKKYPLLKTPILFIRRRTRQVQDFFNPHIRHQIKKDFLPCVLARHQSLLRRKLGESEPRLQEQKIINLARAVEKLNGAVIAPGDIFSLWQIVGAPTYRKGFVDGMLLAGGKVIEGPGGGLCQLSNFLYWIFLHTPMQTVERYHHSMDVFPDSGRTLPFGSGATILYNFIDLKLKNTSHQSLQLKIWLTDNHLKGQVLSSAPLEEKFHVLERNHCFVRSGGRYFRYNEIERERRVRGDVVGVERVSVNFAPTLYGVTEGYLRENGFRVLDLG